MSQLIATLVISGAALASEDLGSAPQEEPDIQFAVYHFKDSINVYISNVEKLAGEGYRLNLTHHTAGLSEYPVYVTIELYKPEGEPEGRPIVRHIITFVPIDTEKFSQGLMEKEGVLEIKFFKLDVSEEVQKQHLDAIHEFTFSVPNEEYTLYLIPDVLKPNDEGEYKFEFQPALNLKTIPKVLVPKD